MYGELGPFSEPPGLFPPPPPPRVYIISYTIISCMNTIELVVVVVDVHLSICNSNDLHVSDHKN